jgi:coproporphyrinogen III oxidase
MNVRYFEMGNHKWFGGGIDLTPHYIVKDDARYFHGELKKMCDRHDQNFYPLYKKDADNYFFIPHRNETRGIGGIFFDRLEATSEKSLEQIFDFVKSTGTLFAPVYCELIERNRNKSFDESGKQWQRLRRGRYVEFNLVYDKGTKFGLETNGRTESILMSLPPEASWTYDFKVKPGSREEETQSLLKKGIDWI